MDRYVGTYRVEIERDINGEPQMATYIPCQYGSKLYRYDDNHICLELVTGNSRNKFAPTLEKYAELIVDCDGGESIWKFHEKYMDEICKVNKPKIHGKYNHPIHN